MAKRRRQPSEQTLATNVSHLRKMLSRVRAQKATVPKADSKGNIKPIKVQQWGSTLIIDGEKITARELEELKGTSQNWRLQAIESLERKLAEQEYKLVQTRKKAGRTVKKTTAISELEKEQALSGVDFVTSEEEVAFAEWLESGSQGIKKAYYYHDYGADTINRADISGFLQYMAMNTGEKIEKVSDLYGIFSDS